VLERYAAVVGDDHTFRFYQMNVQLMKLSEHEARSQR
jgi:hypothetical protein